MLRAAAQTWQCTSLFSHEEERKISATLEAMLTFWHFLFCLLRHVCLLIYLPAVLEHQPSFLPVHFRVEEVCIPATAL